MARTRKKSVEGFARRLQIARERFQPPLSRSQIMEACGVSSQALYKWETNAEPAIKPGNLFALADLLKVRPRWLAVEKGPMEIELPSDAELLAEDWTTLPAEYRAAIRKHTDDLLAALVLMPGLRRPLGDERVGKFLQAAPGDDEGPTKDDAAQDRQPLYRSTQGPPSPSDLKLVTNKKLDPKGKKKP